MGCVGVGGVVGDWAGYGRGGGLDFCSYFKKTFPLLFFKGKNASITHQEYEPKNTKLSKKTPITH